MLEIQALPVRYTTTLANPAGGSPARYYDPEALRDPVVLMSLPIVGNLHRELSAMRVQRGISWRLDGDNLPREQDAASSSNRILAVVFCSCIFLQ